MLSSRSARPLVLVAAGTLAALALQAAPAGASAPDTTTSPARGAAGWLAQQFSNHFNYPGTKSFDGGTTADAIYALAAAGVGKQQITAAIHYFAANVDFYTSVSDTSGKPGPYDGSVGKAAVAGLVAGADPTHFGGYDLLQTLKDDQCTSASMPKNGNDFTTPTCPASGSARNIYSSISESLAVLAEARGAAKYGASYAPDAAAMTYFLSLQCPNGGFTADTSGGKHCVSDPDATGYAMMALRAARHQAAPLHRAAAWLTSVRNADGSWTAQHVHNVDSTGLAAAALHAQGVNTSRTSAWLASQQMTTGPTVGPGASRGALKYQGTFDPASSIKATADGILGMVGNGDLATLSDASAIASSPLLALTPASVRHARLAAGTTQTVTATGFAAHEHVTGTLHSAPSPVGRSLAGKDGTVTLTFTVPKSLAGQHAVTLTGVRSGLTTTSASFHVVAATPAPTHSPTPTATATAPTAPAPASSSAPTLADTGLDLHRTGIEIAVGVGLVLTGALTVLLGRRRRG